MPARCGLGVGPTPHRRLTRVPTRLDVLDDTMQQCPLVAVPLSLISATLDQTWCGDEPSRGLSENNRFTLQLQDGTREQVKVCLSVSGKVGLRHSSMKPSASEPATLFTSEPATLFSMRSCGQLHKPIALRPSANREPPSTNARTSTAQCHPDSWPTGQPPLATSPKDLPSGRPSLSCSARTIRYLQEHLHESLAAARWPWRWPYLSVSATTEWRHSLGCWLPSRNRSKDAAGIDRA
jgi:hypothetical protein